MRKAILFVLCAILFASCADGDFYGDETEGAVVSEKTGAKKFTFTVKGEFSQPEYEGMTRGYLDVDGKAMTDLWVYDYVDGHCVQTLHQVPADSAWGRPQLSLDYGTHHVYFVASRGKGAVADTAANTITWTSVSDTFWKDYTVEVKPTSNGRRAVTLERVATRLRVCFEDKVPANMAAVAIAPSHWYYGLDYVSGAAVADKNKPLRFDIPADYAGRDGFTVSAYGISPAEEWTTDVGITATDGGGAVIGEGTIEGAPMMRNRTTVYTGRLFGEDEEFEISLADGWSDDKTGTF